MVRINGVDVDAADTNLQEYLLKKATVLNGLPSNGTDKSSPHHIRQRIAQRRRFS